MTTSKDKPSRSRVGVTGRFLFVALALAIPLVITSCKTRGPRPSGAVPDNRDLRTFPPAVLSATLEPLENPTAGGNALLEVKFDPNDSRVSKGVRIFADDRAIDLRDDGANGDRKRNDGIFSAFVQEDLQSIARAQVESQKRFTNQPPRAIFRGREIIGLEDPKTLRDRFKRIPIDGERFIPGRKIDLFDLFSSIDPLSINAEKSLMITAPSVIQDPTRTVSPCPADPNGPGVGNPDGVWTFKHLMTEMANQAATAIDPRDFVEQWLLLWNAPQTVSSGFIAAPRPNILPRVLNNWPRVGGKLDLNRSPFRLGAIVNRIDLAGNLVYGGGSAGEGRFVFGIMNNETADACDMLPFVIIFEYGVTVNGCSGLKSWAQQWINLDTHALGSPAYNTALEAITVQFTARNAAPAKPNGSAINQLRSNENGLNQLWELREFRVSAATHHLFEDTTKQTPDLTLDQTTTLRDYINGNEAAILNDAHVVPDSFPPGVPFMAATSRATPGQFDTHFAAAGIANNDARFHFSLNTCAPCHIRETSTPFLHVDPRTLPATLSRFLTGSTPSITDSPDLFNVNDPVAPATIRQFNDLDRRRQKIANIAGKTCLSRFIVPDRFRLELPRRPRPGPPPFISDPRLDGIQDTLRMTH